jgi:16S rRNA (guanine(966)-N(2))-methyltransferase RsmD
VEPFPPIGSIVRITGGIWKGVPIRLPRGPKIRPTQDRVRQALFHLLGEQAVVGTKVLDLFCGSGALGLEALSRGAAEATFVDRSRFCLEAVEANWATCMGRGLSRSQPARICSVRADAIQAVEKFHRHGKRFDLVFLDPPYGHHLARKVLIALGRYVIVTPIAWVVVEHDKRDPLPPTVEVEGGQMVLHRTQRYGDTALTLYRRQ